MFLMITKSIANYDGLETQRCDDIKGIVANEIDPKSFRTLEKQAPGPGILQLLPNSIITNKQNNQ